MPKDLIALGDEHAVASFDKQLHLQELIAHLDWSFQLDTGLLSFGGSWQWRAQILGTQAEQSNTWLWAWANDASAIPAQLLTAAEVLRFWGERWAIPQLTEAEIPVGEFDGDYFARLACGLCPAEAYFRGEHPGGAVYLLICDESYPRCRDRQPLRVFSVFSQALTSLPIRNHKSALLAYLKYCGLTHRWDGGNLIVEHVGQDVITASFDDRDRLIRWNGVFGGADNAER